MRAMRFWTLLALASAVRANPGACQPPQGGATGFVANFYLMDYSSSGSGPDDIGFMETGYLQQDVIASTLGVTSPGFALDTPLYWVGPYADYIYGQQVYFTNVGVGLLGYFVPPELGTWTLSAATVNALVVRVGAASAFECCQSTVLAVGDFALYLVGQTGTSSYAFSAGLYYPLTLFWVNYQGDALLLFSMTSPSGQVYTDFSLLVVAIPDGAPCPVVVTTTVYGAVAATSTQPVIPGGTVTVVVEIPYSTFYETLYWTGGAEDWTAFGGATETVEVLLPAQTTTTAAWTGTEWTTSTQPAVGQATVVVLSPDPRATATTYGPVAGTATLYPSGAATVSVVVTEPNSSAIGEATATQTLAETTINPADGSASTMVSQLNATAALSPSSSAAGSSSWHAIGTVGATSAETSDAWSAEATGASLPLSPLASLTVGSGSAKSTTNGTQGVEPFSSASFASSASPSSTPLAAPSLNLTTATAALAGASTDASTSVTLGSATDASISVVSTHPSHTTNVALTTHMVTQALSSGLKRPSRAISISQLPPVPVSWAVSLSRLADLTMASLRSRSSQTGSPSLEIPAETRDGGEVSSVANSSWSAALLATMQADANVSATLWHSRSASSVGVSSAPRTDYGLRLSNRTAATMALISVAPDLSTAANTTPKSATDTVPSATWTAAIVDHNITSSTHVVTQVPSPVLKSSVRASSGFSNATQTQLPPSLVVPIGSLAISMAERSSTSASLQTCGSTCLLNTMGWVTERPETSLTHPEPLPSPTPSTRVAAHSATNSSITHGHHSSPVSMAHASHGAETRLASIHSTASDRERRHGSVDSRTQSKLNASSATASSNRTLEATTVSAPRESKLAALHTGSLMNQSFSRSSVAKRSQRYSRGFTITWRGSSAMRESSASLYQTLHFVTESTFTASTIAVEDKSLSTSTSKSSRSTSSRQHFASWRWISVTQDSSATLTNTLHHVTVSTLPVSRVLYTGSLESDSLRISVNSHGTSRSSVSPVISSQWRLEGFTTTWRSSARESSATVSLNKTLQYFTMSSPTASQGALPRASSLEDAGIGSSASTFCLSTTSPWHPKGFTTTWRGSSESSAPAASFNKSLHSVTVPTPTSLPHASFLLKASTGSSDFSVRSSQWHSKGFTTTRETTPTTSFNIALHFVTISTFPASTVAALNLSSLEDENLGAPTFTSFPSTSSQLHYFSWRGSSATRESYTTFDKTLPSVTVWTFIAPTVAVLHPSLLEDPSISSTAFTLSPLMSSRWRSHGYANTTRLLRGSSATLAVANVETADPASSFWEGPFKSGIKPSSLLTSHTSLTVDSASSVPFYASNSAYGSTIQIVAVTSYRTTETVPPSDAMATALSDTAIRLDVSSHSTFDNGNLLANATGSAAKQCKTLILSIKGSVNAQAPSVVATIASTADTSVIDERLTGPHRASGSFAHSIGSKEVSSHTLRMVPGSLRCSAAKSPAASTKPPLIADTTMNADPKFTPTATLTFKLSNEGNATMDGAATITLSALPRRASTSLKSVNVTIALELSLATSTLVKVSLASLSSETGPHSGVRHLSFVVSARPRSSGFRTSAFVSLDSKLAPSAAASLDPTQGVWETLYASAYAPRNRTAAALLGPTERSGTLKGPHSSLAEIKPLLWSLRLVSTKWSSDTYPEALSVSLMRPTPDGQPSQVTTPLPLSTADLFAATSHTNAFATHSGDTHLQATSDFTFSPAVSDYTSAMASLAFTQPTLVFGVASSDIARFSKTVHSEPTGPSISTRCRLSFSSTPTPARSTSSHGDRPSETDPLGSPLVTTLSTQTRKGQHSGVQDEAATEVSSPCGQERAFSMLRSVEPGTSDLVVATSEPSATIAVTSRQAAHTFTSNGSSSLLIYTVSFASHDVSTPGERTATMSVLSESLAPFDGVSRVSKCMPPVAATAVTTLQQFTYLASIPVPRPSIPESLLHNTGYRLQPFRKGVFFLLSALFLPL